MKFSSLHNHSTLSISQGLSYPGEIISKAKGMYESVAITDSDTMAGIWDGLKSARKEKYKFIPGCEVNFLEDISSTIDNRFYQLVLLAKNYTGYKNLLKLRKLGFENMLVVNKTKSCSRIDWKLLEEYSEGLICLSGGGIGFIPQLIMRDKNHEALIAAKRFHEIFKDDFALELQGTNLQMRPSPYNWYVDQRKINVALKRIIDETGIKAVVTNPIYYIEKEHHDACDVLMAIGASQPLGSGQRFRLDKKDFYMKSPEEIEAFFTRHKNFWGEKFIQSMFENTVYYSDKCEFPEWIDPRYSNPSGKELPEFPVKDQKDYDEFVQWKESSKDSPSLLWKEDVAEDAKYYRFRSEKGLFKKIQSGKIPEQDKEYCVNQLEIEFDVLEYKGFSGYMLIVADFLDWCRDNGIPVGPGRGSVGGCLSAFLNGIHQAYGKNYGMIFSRFLNKEKEAYPDIDSDIAPSGRERLHDYLKEKYGTDCVAHVSNISTVTPKVYARDIARTLDYGKGDRKLSAAIGDNIADSIDEGIKSVRKALIEAPMFSEYAKQYPELEMYADLLDGKPKNWSTHAAGVVISKRPIHEIVPLRRDASGAYCLEMDKDRAEETGLVKMDTLGLETLDIIKDTYKLAGLDYDWNFDYEGYDKGAYELISNGNTSCMFQLDGTAVSTCKLVKPSNVAEIGIVTALIRPSSKDIIPDYVKVRNGEHQFELLHPALENSLKSTLGFGLYEECLMQIALDIPKWSLWKADGLRKMTKDKGKHPEKTEKLRSEFIDDSEKNGIARDIAEQIWDSIISSFSGYGFNLSHATLYSMVSYQTAYMKSNYFIEFMVANLRSKIGKNSPKAKDAITKIKNEIRECGVKIIPPDINTSDVAYKIIDSKTLMTGLNALNNIGKNSIPEIISGRPYKSFIDFMIRADTKKVNSRTIQSLIAGGAFDSFGINRRAAYLHSKDFRDKIKALKKRYEKYGYTATEILEKLMGFQYPIPDMEPWTIPEVYAMEMDSIGEGVSGSIADRYPILEKFGITYSEISRKYKYNNVSEDQKEDQKANTFNLEFVVAGLISTIRIFKVKKIDSKIFGRIMAAGTLMDKTGASINFVCFPDDWDVASEIIKKLTKDKEVKNGMAIIFRGQFQYKSENDYGFIVNEVVNAVGIPARPKDLAAKKIKIPTVKITKKEIEEMELEEAADALDEEMILEGDYDYSEDGDDI